MAFYEVLSIKLCHLQENFYGDHHVKENKQSQKDKHYIFSHAEFRHT